MILGPGWAFLGLLAVGLVALVLVPGCGLVVVNEAPAGQLRLDAPSLVEPDPVVESRTAAVANVSLARARLQARRALLRIRSSCDGVRSGPGFALGPGLLLATRSVMPGAGRLRVASGRGPAESVDASRVYRLGAFGVARVARPLPHVGAIGASPGSGTSVAVVGYPPAGAPSLSPGVVVDTVSGAPLGIDGRLLRLTSTLSADDPGGPVVDARGRVVAVAFATDPRTGLALAAPIGTLRSLVDKGALESLPACGGA